MLLRECFHFITWHSGRLRLLGAGDRSNARRKRRSGGGKRRRPNGRRARRTRAAARARGTGARARTSRGKGRGKVQHLRLRPDSKTAKSGPFLGCRSVRTPVFEVILTIKVGRLSGLNLEMRLWAYVVELWKLHCTIFVK